MFDRRSNRPGDRLRLLFAGPYPEPIGGVSVHIRRLAAWLSTQGIEVRLVDESKYAKSGIYNIRSMRFLAYLRCLGRCNVAHIHSCVHLFRILHIVACRLLGLRVIVTIHGWPSEGAIKSVFTVPINRVVLHLAHKIILVSEGTNRRLGLRRYEVLPAFLPPLGPGQDLPGEIKAFLENARNHGRYLLCANAYELTVCQGEDLYGLDLCVELADRLACRSDVNAAIVFVVSCDTAGNRRFTVAKRMIAERGLQDHFHLCGKPIDFVRLMQQCDLVLRPTSTDGDALTIREALHFGIPVIASDAVQRPSGVVLFRSRDVEDLVHRTVDVLNRRLPRRHVPGETDPDAYFRKYLDLYLGVLDSGFHGEGLPTLSTGRENGETL